jgi:hypothetical protein
MKTAIRKISATQLFLLATLLIAAGLTAACSGGNASPVIPPTGLFSLASVSGSYAFSLAGEDANGNAIFRVGSFQADGGGNITAAIEDVNDAGSVQSFEFLAAPSSTYTMSSNGKGVLTLAHNDPNTPGLVDVFTFTLALTSTSGGVMIETDGTSTMSGNFQLQNITSSFAPSYAFDTSGADVNFGAPESIVGAFTTNGTTSITGGVLDDNDGGTIANQQVISPGSIVPDPTFFTPFGRGQFQINSNIGGQLFDLTFEFYVIDSSHFVFVETDTAKSTEGTATAQSNVPTNVSQFPGSFVLAVSGAANTGPITRVGRYTTDGSGNVSAVALDQHINSNTPTVFPASNSSVSAFTYSIDPSGDGRGTLTLTDQRTGDQFIYVFYLASPSQGFIQDESNNVVADGTLNAQTASGISTSTLAGSYALNWTGSNFGSGQGNEEDLAGVFTFPSGGGSLTNGDLDLAELGAGQIFENVVFSGTLTPTGSGTGGGTAGNTLQIIAQGPVSSTINLRAYAITNTSFIIVSVDANRTVIGPLTLQQ